MKVICAGYWKTGTKSLAAALRILGYKVYDFDDQFLELGDLWDKFHNGTVTDEDIYSSLKDVDVLIDGPVVAFWEEIHKVFKDAKIILTIRDEDAWYKSYQAMHNAVTLKLRLQHFFLMFLPGGYDFLRRIQALLRFTQGIEGPITFRPSDNPRLYKLKVRKHNSYVRECAPDDKLLIHESGKGWEPICRFLGRDIPDELYPHKNKAGSLPILEDSCCSKYKNILYRAEMIMYCAAVVFSLLTCWIAYCMFS